MSNTWNNGVGSESMPTFTSVNSNNSGGLSVSKGEAKQQAREIQNRSNAWMSGGGKVHVQVTETGDITATRMNPVVLKSSEIFGSDTSGLLSTCVSRTGRPLTMSEVTEDALITIGGQTMTVEMAHRLGFIGRSEAGTYYDSNAPAPRSRTAEQRSAPQRAKEAAEAEADNNFMLVSPEVGEHIVALFEHHGVSDGHAEAILAKAVGALLVDGPGSPVCKEMAGLCNMEVKTAAEILSAFVTHIAENASALVSRLLADRGRNYSAQQTFDWFMSMQSEVRANLGVRFLHGDRSAIAEFRDRIMTGNRF